MKIAVLGWGSLIWKPGQLDIEPKWHEDGPELPVEFARVSSGNRLTLVLVDGCPLQKTLWAMSRKMTLAEAVEDLRIREGPTKNENIGRWDKGQEVDSRFVNVLPVISEWAMRHDLDGVVWTALGPMNPNREPMLASNEELMGYLRSLVANGNEAAAREYVQRAPTQIETPMRRRIQAELGWR